MPNVNALIMEANSTVDETFDNADWMAWFNGALGDVAAYLNLEGKTTIKVDYDKYDTETVVYEFQLPTDCIKLEAVYDKDMNPVTVQAIGDRVLPKSVCLFNNTLLVSTDTPIGTEYTLVYTRRPAQLRNDSDIPELPEEFQQLLVIYGCYKSQLKDDELERAQLFYAEYVSQKRSLIDYMRKFRPARTYTNHRWKVIR